MKNNMTETPQILLSCQSSNLLPFCLSLQCRYNRYPGHPHHQSSLLCFLQPAVTLSVLQNSYTAGRFFPWMLTTTACLLLALQPWQPSVRSNHHGFSVTFLFLTDFISSLSNHNLIFYWMRASYTDLWHASTTALLPGTFWSYIKFGFGSKEHPLVYVCRVAV